MYKYDKEAASNALGLSKVAVEILGTVPDDLKRAASLASSVKVDGLQFLSDGKYSITIDVISNYPGIIINMINESERASIIEYLENGDIEGLVNALNEGEIDSQTLIEYSKEYAIDIMNSGKTVIALLTKDRYHANYEFIGGDTPDYDNVFLALEARGFKKEFIDNLNTEFCRNIINNDLYYTKEGVTTCSVAFTGFLSMFGIKLGYNGKQYESQRNGVWFTTGEKNSPVLGDIDCCNYTDWLARCVGVDIGNGGVLYKADYYCRDGITPDSEIMAPYESKYFKNGEGGDYLIRPTGSGRYHIQQIIANDGEGYFYSTDGSRADGCVFEYATYEELKNDNYTVTNSDALYRNTAPPSDKRNIYFDEDGNYVYAGWGPVSKKQTEVFIDPKFIIEQPNINLTLEEQESLIRQYNERSLKAHDEIEISDEVKKEYREKIYGLES